MRICFIHQNIPGQFRHLIEVLLRQGENVILIGEQAAVKRWPVQHPRLSVLSYELPTDNKALSAPPHLRELELQTLRGQRVATALQLLAKKGVRPDLVVVHPGWGEAMFIRAELPDTPLLAYCEFFYRVQGADVGFDPEYPAAEAASRRLQLRKLPHLLSLDDMDAGLSPTRWQRAQYPALHQPRIAVIHDGINTEVLKPQAGGELTLAGRTLKHGDPVVTYVSRNLEPYRGFHVFMRSLPLLQQLCPEAVVVIVGGDEVSYGSRLPAGQSYRQRLLDELGDRIDHSRVLFTGKLPYASYVALLRLSAVHAYLTYPFVLSWSLLEAMSLGCCIVASRTPPVEEVIDDGVHGLLVDFFAAEALARRLSEVLAGRVDSAALRAAARQRVVDGYDLQRHCLPASLALLRDVAERRPLQQPVVAGVAAPAPSA